MKKLYSKITKQGSVLALSSLLLCANSFAQSNCEFKWNDVPTISASDSKVATGMVNGVKYTYTSSSNILTTPSVVTYSAFPAELGIPNQTCIKNINATQNVLEFEKPVKDPLLVFSSIGRAAIDVSVIFHQKIEVIFENGIVSKNDTSLTGREGFAVVRILGMYSKIAFEYTQQEDYVNFAFGAGICPPCEFVWSSIPTINGSKATGTLGDATYTYTSDQAVQTTDKIFSYSTFPTSLGIPNQVCIKNILTTNNKLEFSQPVQDPVLVFSSIGAPGIEVPIIFQQDFIVEFQEGITSIVGKTVTGKEGYLVARFPGTYSALNFKYTANENYANFVFGAAALCKKQVITSFEDNNTNEVGLTISPNPVANVLNLGKNVNSEIIEIHTLTGAQVMQIKSNGNTVDVSELTSGVYILSVGNQKRKFYKL